MARKHQILGTEFVGTHSPRRHWTGLIRTETWAGSSERANDIDQFRPGRWLRPTHET
jgi:hypothetical protein